ncbi:hypothetical protein [Orientia tsutsugamushi]|nr:hypothetical protein [Orientia tsutsugamushi]
MPLFIYFFLYSFHIGILCTYFLRSCYTLSAYFFQFVVYILLYSSIYL